MEHSDISPKWAARLDARRAVDSPGYSDLLKLISAYYDMYERGTRFMSPFISRQIGSLRPFISPERDEVKAAVGKISPLVHSIVQHSFVGELINFATTHKGKRQLITPNPATHHSAQFPSGTFSIERCQPVNLIGRQPTKQLFKIEIFGALAPIYVEDLQLQIDTVRFIIVRPKIGKLGTASALNWEVLFFKNSFGYLINHVDSTLNPRWAGVL